MPCALYGANERNRYVGRRWRLPVPPLQSVRGAQRGLLPEDAAAVLRRVWARGPKDMNHAVQPRPRPLPLEIRGTLWMHPNSNSETSVLGQLLRVQTQRRVSWQLLRVQTQRRVSAQATSNSETSAPVPSCPRALVPSCPLRQPGPALEQRFGVRHEWHVRPWATTGNPEKRRSQNPCLNPPE